MTMIVYLAGIAFLAYVSSRFLSYQQDKSSPDYNAIPRILTRFPPVSIYGSLLPASVVKYGLRTVWDFKESLYNGSPSRTVVFQPLILGRRSVCSANIAALRHVLAVGAPFKKPDTPVLKIMGENVVTSNGETWRRHRRVTGPAFNHNTYRNVWETTASVYEEMIKEEGWLGDKVGKEVNINENTHKLALFLVAMVGFGIPMSWSTPPFDEHGKRSVQSLVFDISANIMARGTLPRWSYKLGIKKFDDIENAYNAFEEYVIKLIAQREIELKNSKAVNLPNGGAGGDNIKDILGRLVNSRLTGGKLTLTDEEIMGNCFIFAFAGHETTANTLAATLAELSLNPDKQDWVYNRIIEAIGDRTPTFEDYDSLESVLACFYEALRMYPAAYLLVRESETDDTLNLGSASNSKENQVFIRKGDQIILDIVGISYDPDLYPDPNSFVPERWLASRDSEKKTSITKDLDAGEVSGASPANSLNGFIGFSIGPRTCIGHKFAKVEAVAFLTLLLREWRIEPVLRPGEVESEWKKRVLSSASIGITLAFDSVPLRFCKRSR